RRHTRFSRDWSSDVCSTEQSLLHPLSRLLHVQQDPSHQLNTHLGNEGILNPHLGNPLNRYHIHRGWNYHELLLLLITFQRSQSYLLEVEHLSLDLTQLTYDVLFLAIGARTAIDKLLTHLQIGHGNL